MGVTRTICPTTPPSSITGMPGARPALLPLLKTRRWVNALVGSYMTSTTTADCATVSVTPSRRRSCAFSAASWAACVATWASSMRWRCRASFSLRMRLAALTHSFTCWTRSRGAMTARWKGYSATDIARRAGSSMRHCESMMIRARARTTRTTSRTSAGGPRLNRGGVPCRCMNLSPDARARRSGSGRSREKARLRAGGQN
ncbi:hypothetical protein D9M68_799770 [compost metagenome]